MERLFHQPPLRDDFDYYHQAHIMIGEISALYIDNDSDSTNIFCHGIKSDLVDVYPYIKKLPKTKNHLFFDYPGYGLSSGEPRENDCVQSLKEVVEFASGKKIHLFGHSMGCYMLAKFCSENQWKHPVTMISPFHSLKELIGLDFGYDTSKHVKKMICDITFYHGSEDETIPVSHSEMLASIHSSPLHIKQANHVSILDHVLVESDSL